MKPRKLDADGRRQLRLLKLADVEPCGCEETEWLWYKILAAKKVLREIYLLIYTLDRKGIL